MITADVMYSDMNERICEDKNVNETQTNEEKHQNTSTLRDQQVFNKLDT